MKNIAQGKNAYYRYIEEMWEVNYGMSLQIHVFKCQWVKHPQGVEVDEYDFTIVDLRNVCPKDEPWVLGKQRVVGVDNVEDEEE
jgi:hypothetical protein